MFKKTYVTHCASCSRLILKEDRETKPCPAPISGPVEGMPYFTMGVTEYGEKKDGSSPYYDENLNTFIHSKAHKAEELAKRGYTQVDSGARKKPKTNRLYFT